MKVMGLLVLAGMAVSLSQTATAADAPTVIELTQVPCQFVESENGVDHSFTSAQKADCEAINQQSGADRLATAEALRLAPGDYVFRVSNKSVPYELGFWLRSADFDWRNPLHRLNMTNVSGGGLTEGTTKDYAVTLQPGEYVYSCPLNPTPDYRIIVGEGPWRLGPPTVK